GLAGELDAELRAAGVELAEVVGGEPELDSAGGILFGRGVKGKDGLAGRELGPEGRLELELEAELVAVEGDCPVHVVDELDRVVQAHRSSPISAGVRRSFGRRGFLRR